MTKYEGENLNNATFVLEDSYFLNCVLTDCDVFYSGGDLEMVNTRFENTRWHFRGAALKTVQTLQKVGMLKRRSVFGQNRCLPIKSVPRSTC